MCLHKEQPEGFTVLPRTTLILQKLCKVVPHHAATTQQKKERATKSVILESGTLLSEQNDKKQRCERFQLAA